MKILPPLMLSFVLLQFITLCGNAQWLNLLSSPSPTLPQQEATMYHLQQWAQQDGYRIRVHTIKEATVYDTGLLNPKDVRTIRVYVEYENQTAPSLNYRLSQWLLYDQRQKSSQKQKPNQPVHAP